MRVLVTGGAGFIGSHIVDALLKEGHEVGVIDDLSTGRRENLNPLVHFVELDIRNEEGVAEVMSNGHFDAVCHQAAQTSVVVSTREPLRDASINVIGTIVLLEACVRFGVKRFVFASTGGAIYGEVPEPEIAKPGRKEKPISPYACSKLAGEVYVQRYAREHGLQATILRYANVYGPRQDPHGEAGVVAIFTERMLRGEPVRINARRSVGDDGCVRDYVYVEDVVKANLLALKGKLSAPIYHCATGRGTTTRSLAEMLKALTGSTSEMIPSPHRPGDVERSVLEPHPEVIGGEAPTPLEQGLKLTVEWFRKKAHLSH